MKFAKKSLALILSLMLCLSMLPTTVFAAGGDHEHTWVFDHIPSGQLCTAIHTEVWKCACGKTDTRLGQPARDGHAMSYVQKDDKNHIAQCTVCYWHEDFRSHKFAGATCQEPGTCKCGLVDPKGKREQCDYSIPATCVSNATCKWCGAEDPNGSVDSANHANVVTDNAVTANCVTDGKTEGSHCTACDTVIVEQRNLGKAADKHAANCTLGDWVKTATEHYKEYSQCKAKAQEDDHNFVDGKCTVCGYECLHSSKTYVVSGNGHTWTCGVCGASGSEAHKVINATGWDALRAGMCPGQSIVQHGFCSLCDAGLVPVILTGTGSHALSTQPGKAATCNATGIMEHEQCSKCLKKFIDGEEVTDVTLPIKPDNHSGTTGQGNKWVPINAERHGKVCTDCGKEYATGAAGWHTYGSWSYDAESGIWSHTCTKCGYLQTSEAKPDHDCTKFWSEGFYPDEDGTGHHQVCTFPGCENVNETVAHSEGVVTKEGVGATCGTAGLTEETECPDCGYVLQEQTEISATGNHTWDGGVVTTPATATTAGVRTYTCTVCGATRTAPIAATGTGGTEVEEPEIPLGGDPDDGGEVDIGEEEIPLAGLMTRAEFVNYLWEFEGKPESAATTFVDVPEDHEYYEAIGWAEANKIALGVDETHFQPDVLVNVGHARLFLARYAQFKGIELPELTTLVGLDDAILENAGEVLNEFPGPLPSEAEDEAA